MVSAAEQLARNISFSTFAKAKELQARIWFTLIALIVYRIGTQVPIPGIDTAVYAAPVRPGRRAASLACGTRSPAAPWSGWRSSPST